VVIIMSLLGGLALFLYGMKIMGDGLEKFSGDSMRKFLEIVTVKPVMGVFVGTIVAATIHSSSATTVMVVGFVNAGLMTLRQAIGVIMGANIGTTVNAQIIAFRLEDYVLPVIALGFLMYAVGKRKSVKYIGQFTLGFGVLFLGLSIMSDSVAPLRGNPTLINTMASLGAHPWLAMLAGTVMTVMIQSSSATIGMLMALASQGIVTLDAAVPILLGDNIGTCITALLASIGTNLSARRAAVAHIVFNVFGAILFLVGLRWFIEFVLLISPQGDISRQIANAHTSFNILSTIIFLPLVGFLEKTVILIVPGEEDLVRTGPIYLDERILNSPSIALSLASKEIVRMAYFCRDNLQLSMQAFFEKDMKAVNQVLEMEEVIDGLEKSIAFYLAKAAQHSMIPELSDKHSMLLNAVNDFERVGDHAENVTNLAQKRIEEKLPFSENAEKELKVMHDYVLETFEKAIYALEHEDNDSALEVKKRERKIDNMEKLLRSRHIRRLNAGLCYPASGVVFLDIISNFERIGDHSHNVANLVLGSSLPPVDEDVMEEIYKWSI
jgi:phosphate:Na+ symporter